MKTVRGYVFCLLVLIALVLTAFPALAGDEPAKGAKPDGPEITLVKNCNLLGANKQEIVLMKKGGGGKTFAQVYSSYPGFKKVSWALMKKGDKKAVLAIGLIHTRKEMAEILAKLKKDGGQWLIKAGNSAKAVEGLPKGKINKVLDAFAQRKPEYVMLMAFVPLKGKKTAVLTRMGGVFINDKNMMFYFESKVKNYNLKLDNLHKNIDSSEVKRALAQAVFRLKLK